MLIDKYLMKFDFNEIHQIAINGSPADIYSIIKEVDFTKSWIIKLLFSLRRLSKEMNNLTGFISAGFILLDEKQNEEVVLGFLGNIRGLHNISPKEFQIFSQKGHVMCAWNFSLSKLDKNRTSLSTETRVFCSDKKTKFIFSLYWFIISLFSALTRKIMLKLLKEKAEIKR